VAGVRYGNVTRLTEYNERLLGPAHGSELISPAAGSAEAVGEADSRSESMFLGLRMLSGVSPQLFRRRHGTEIKEAYGPELRALESQGLLELTGDRIRLTAKGLPVANRVFEAFV
jgi:oxygen-independent coproporphyrinogen-3 oxidase